MTAPPEPTSQESGLEQRRDAMFRGELINTSEHLPVLHVALRMPCGSSLTVEDVGARAHEVLDPMAAFAAAAGTGANHDH